jgi:hypothetical protein
LRRKGETMKKLYEDQYPKWSEVLIARKHRAEQLRGRFVCLQYVPLSNPNWDCVCESCLSVRKALQ